MEVMIGFLGQLTDPDWILSRGGLYLVLIILFIETGLFFGFFLPGDPLLFISGVIVASADAATPFADGLYNLIFWETLFIVSTVLGNMVGYWSGYKFRHFFRNKKSWFLNPDHIRSAEMFYRKRGGFAIFIARFLPIVRTFVPIVGGVVRMNFSRFMLYNILGAVFWVGTITTSGFLLGENQWVARNLEYVILGLVLIVTVPVLFQLIFRKKVSAQNS